MRYMFAASVEKQIGEEAFLRPRRAYPFDAGVDLAVHCFLDSGMNKMRNVSLRLKPGDDMFFTTGIHVEIPVGYVGILKERSSKAKEGLIVKGGVIDSGYRGEIVVMMANVGRDVIDIGVYQRVVQMVIVPVALTEWYETPSLDDTTVRGEKALGSSGEI